MWHASYWKNPKTKQKQTKNSSPHFLLPQCVVHANIHRIFLHIISLQGDCKAVSSLCKDCSLMMQVEQRDPNKINAQQGVSSLCCSSNPPYIGKRDPVTKDSHLFHSCILNLSVQSVIFLCVVRCKRYIVFLFLNIIPWWLYGLYRDCKLSVMIM